MKPPESLLTCPALCGITLGLNPFADLHVAPQELSHTSSPEVWAWLCQGKGCSRGCGGPQRPSGGLPRLLCGCAFGRCTCSSCAEVAAASGSLDSGKTCIFAHSKLCTLTMLQIPVTAKLFTTNQAREVRSVSTVLFV